MDSSVISTGNDELMKIAQFLEYTILVLRKTQAVQSSEKDLDPGVPYQGLL